MEPQPARPQAAPPENQTTDETLPAADARAFRGVTLRSVLLGLLLAVPNAFWITIVEVRWYTLDGTCLPLFITPVFFLFWLTLANLGLRRFPKFAQRFALSQAELLTVYIILVVGTLTAGHDLFQNLFGSIAHPAQYATPENKWRDLFFPFLPQFWIVSDPVAVKGYYQGSVNPYDPHYWGPFVAPLLWWTLFIGTIIAMCACLNILVRSAWSDNERLAFPIVQLPLTMTAEEGQGTGAVFYRQRLMWIGFALAAGVDLLNGLHVLYPSLPYLEMVKQFNIGQLLTTRPLERHPRHEYLIVSFCDWTGVFLCHWTCRFRAGSFFWPENCFRFSGRLPDWTEPRTPDSPSSSSRPAAPGWRGA